MQTRVVVEGVQIFLYSIYLLPSSTVEEQKEFMRQLLWRIECQHEAEPASFTIVGGDINKVGMAYRKNLEVLGLRNAIEYDTATRKEAHLDNVWTNIEVMEAT